MSYGVITCGKSDNTRTVIRLIENRIEHKFKKITLNIIFNLLYTCNRSIGPIICGIVSVFMVMNKSVVLSLSSTSSRIIIFLQIIFLFLISASISYQYSFITLMCSWTSILIIPRIFFRNPLLPVSIRLLTIFLSLAPSFCFLGVNHEALFFPCLYLHLVYMIFIESRSKYQNENTSNPGVDTINEKIEKQNGTTIVDSESSNSSRQLQLVETFRLAWMHVSFIILKLN